METEETWETGDTWETGETEETGETGETAIYSHEYVRIICIWTARAIRQDR